MGRVKSTNWLRRYDGHSIKVLFASTVGRLTYQKTCPVHGDPESGSSNTPTQLVIQIGNCPDRRIAYYAADFPQSPCVGTDVIHEFISLSTQ